MGCLNYISDYYQNLAKEKTHLTARLKKNPPDWMEAHTAAVRRIKEMVKSLPCLSIANPNLKKIVETDASNKGYGGILKQVNGSKEELVMFHSGQWNPTQVKYSTIKKRCFLLLTV